MMQKHNKNVSVTLNISYPTVSEFKRFVLPKLKVKKMQPNKLIAFSKVPKYLKEIECSGNPFKAIKMTKTKELQNLENIRLEFEKERQNFPIQDKNSRDVRIMFNARRKLKQLKNMFDMKESHEKSEEQFPKLPRTKFFSNADFILDKRRVCLLELAIKIKEKQLKRLENIVEVEERQIRKEYERLENEQKIEDDHLKLICEKTSCALKLLDRETEKKNRINAQLQKIFFRMAKLNAEYSHLESEYIKSKTYKDFLQNAFKQNEVKQAIEKTTKMEEIKIDAVLIEIEKEKSYLLKDMGNEASSGYSMLNRDSTMNYQDETDYNRTSYQFGSNNYNVDNSYSVDTRSFNKEELEKLKASLFSGLSDTNNDDVSTKSTSNAISINKDSVPENISESVFNEEDIRFSNPQDLVNIFTELEINNLCLIENVQEQEEMCDSMRKRTSYFKRQIERHIFLINFYIDAEKIKIQELNDSIKYLIESGGALQKYNDIERYKEMFCLVDVDVTTLDELIEYMNERISKLYFTIIQDSDPSGKDTIEMLRKIEILIDSLYLEIQAYDSKEIVRVKKILDERKILASRVKQLQLLKSNQKAKIQKTLEEANRPPRYQRGRKIVYRSKPEKEILKVSKENKDNIRLEEYAFFFT